MALTPKTWPPSLPQYVEQDGYSEELGDNKIRTQTDIGPAKTRRRSTSAPTTYKITLPSLDSGQVTNLIDFYQGDCKAGMNPVSWKHPRTQSPATLYWVSPPKFLARGVRFITSFIMEIRP